MPNSIDLQLTLVDNLIKDIIQKSHNTDDVDELERLQHELEALVIKRGTALTIKNINPPNGTELSTGVPTFKEC